MVARSWVVGRLRTTAYRPSRNRPPQAAMSWRLGSWYWGLGRGGIRSRFVAALMPSGLRGGSAAAPRVPSTEYQVPSPPSRYCLRRGRVDDPAEGVADLAADDDGVRAAADVPA